MRDPYAVLGVARTATEKEIKSAFRKLAKTYHPDANPGDASAGARFNEVNQAYEILGDKDKRGQFDRGEIDGDGKPKFQGNPFGAGGGPFGGGSFRGAGRAPFGNEGSFEFRSDGSESSFADFFEQAFGGGTGGGRRGGGFSAARNAATRGENIQATLKVRLEDIVSKEGVEAVFPSGARLLIKMPDGVENGQTIRLRGKGEPAPVAGGQPGDALVTIEFVPHPRFEAVGRDLKLDLPVPIETAVLGGRLTVDTLDGRVALRLPAWSNSGKTLRLKGKGLTTKDGGRGDILVQVRIVLPDEPDSSLTAFFTARQPATAD